MLTLAFVVPIAESGVPAINDNQTLQVASQLHGQGRLKEAEALYRQVLARDRRNADALHLLGILLHQTGRTAEGIDSIRRAIMIEGRAQFYENLANVYSETGQFELAVECLRKASMLEPGAVEVRLRLARFLNAELKRPAEAAEVLRGVLAIQPNHGEALGDLAVALHRSGDRKAALESYEKALRVCPNDADLMCNYGIALNEMEQYERALALFGRGLHLQPRHATLWYNLGLAQMNHGQVEEAIKAYKAALEINPDYAAANFYLSIMLCADGQLEESAELYSQSLKTGRERAEAFSHVGTVRMLQGHMDEAIDVTRKAIAIEPDYELAWHNLMMALNYHPDDDPAKLLAEHRAWGQRHANRYPVRHYKNDHLPDRKLRIGYVSPDFRAHSVAFFMEPILAGHDGDRFEVFCYANHPKDDAVTALLKGYGHHWRDICGLSDDKVADLIQQDQIDLLIDLAVHTNGNRLLVFARKPAPIQGTYLGYAATTGLEAIDFRLTDPWIDPPGNSDSYGVERLIRLPETQWVYRPPPNAPEVSPVPAERNGHITFGVATNLSKVNAPTVKQWSQALCAVPESVLVIKASSLGGAVQTSGGGGLSALAQYGGERTWQSLRQHYADLFGRSGVAEDRFRIEPTSSMTDYCLWYSQIDVILDTFPFAGGTTTCHSLWMGVPVVTRTGRTSVSRVGSSILHNIGLGELVADTREKFVSIAADLADNLPKLAEWRQTMRERMRQSPLMNEAHFVKHLESAYRELWQAWCAKPH